MAVRTSLAMIVMGLAGCGGYIGTGAAPRLDAQRNLTLQVKVGGDSDKLVERALKWVLAGSSTVKRVNEGGDLQLALTGKLSREAFVLGTDCSFALRASTVEGDAGEERTFVKKSITGNLEVETERLITEAVVWALERAAKGPIATRPVETPPPDVVPVPSLTPPPSAPPSIGEQPVDPASNKAKKGRPRRRL